MRSEFTRAVVWPNPRLPRSWGGIDGKLKSSNTTNAVGSVKAGVAEQVESHRPKPAKQRGHKGYRVNLRRRLRCS